MIEKRISEDLIGKVIVWVDPNNSSTVMLKVDKVTNHDSVGGKWAYIKDFPNGEMRFTRQYEMEIPTKDGYVKCDIVSERAWNNVVTAYNEYIGDRDFLANMLQPTYY